MSATKTITLEQWQIKEMLQNIEDADGKISFRSICNQSDKVYGTSGSNLRRAFQRKWDKVHRMKIGKYVKYLEKYDVGLSAGTQKNSVTQLISKATHLLKKT